MVVKMPYADSEAQREAMRRWRQAHPDYHKDYNATHPRSESTLAKDRQRTMDRYREGRSRTFIGCDGEGMGDGSAHRYYVLRMGDRQLITGQPLTSWECLNFIGSQPYGSIYSIFAGGYDFTMCLRDAPQEFVRDLLARESRMAGGRTVRPARWGDLRVDYIPHKRLSVRLGDGKPIVIHDAFGFFQSSFVDALNEWQVGTEEERILIKAGKERRGNTNVLSKEELEYNRLECKLLAELMYKLDETAYKIMLSASPYEGAGALASSLLNTHIAKPVKERNRVAKQAGRPLESIYPPDAPDSMPTWAAYYGGRFEITAHGPVPGPVYEYDINSAYPAAIRILPCLHHGKWVEGIREDCISLGHLSWDWTGKPFGPLPHRNRQGNVTFPLRGSGWYWSPEWPDNGYQVDRSWSWVQSCGHRPYEWISQRYDQRKAHKAAGRLGESMMLKLGYNSIYGKLVQNVGQAPWRNSVLGGLVTASCRRWVRDAAMQSPEDIIMFATDGVYSLRLLDLPISAELGEWENTTYTEGLHIVRPGIYFTPDGEAKIKTRGIGRKVVQEYADKIKEAFTEVLRDPSLYMDSQKWGVPIEYNGLVSIRLAYSQNRPEKAGYLGLLPHFMSYDIRPKRVPRSAVFAENWQNGMLRSAPPLYCNPYESIGYDKAPKPDHDDEEATSSAPERMPKSRNRRIFKPIEGQESLF